MIDIVFDGPPGPDGGRFVEVETIDGESVGVGEWIERSDGTHALRLGTDDVTGARMLDELNATHPVHGDDDPDRGHTFFLAAWSQGASRVVGDPHNCDADHVSPSPTCLAVRAHNLPDALREAATASTADWARHGLVGRTDEPVPTRRPIVHPEPPW